MALAGMRSVVDTIAADVIVLNQRFDGVDQRLDGIDQRLDGIDQRLEDTAISLKTQVDSLRDDVRIFAEAHVALEHRVTRFENRPR